MTTACPDLAHTPTSRGFVFATTGAGYTDLADRAAQSLRSVHPDAQIDLFTDQPTEPAVFDRVHHVTNPSRRLKFQSLLDSRFDQTVYLDADTLTLAPVWDVFDVLDRFDIAVAQDEATNSPHGRIIWRREMPTAFPQFNAGVIAIRKSEATDRFLSDCDRVFHQHELATDQPMFRELLFLSDLRIGVLPKAYNCMFVAHLEAQDQMQIAPRILHIPKLHNHLHGHGPQIFTPRQAVGPMIWRHIQAMLASDVTLGAQEWKPVRPLMDQGPLGRLRRYIHNSLRDLSRRKP